jgi:hypothetical protein
VQKCWKWRCKTLVWNNEDNDSHILLASAKSFFEDVESSTIYSSLLHVWKGINLGFRSATQSNLGPELVRRVLRRCMYSSEPSCSLTRTTDLGASGRVGSSYASSLTSALHLFFSLEWAITLRRFHADWKYYHTKPDYFLPGRSTFLIHRCREPALNPPSPRTQHITGSIRAASSTAIQPGRGAQ